MHISQEFNNLFGNQVRPNDIGFDDHSRPDDIKFDDRARPDSIRSDGNF
jgi:hypothetical protein